MKIIIKNDSYKYIGIELNLKINGKIFNLNVMTSLHSI